MKGRSEAQRRTCPHSPDATAQLAAALPRYWSAVFVAAWLGSARAGFEFAICNRIAVRARSSVISHRLCPRIRLGRSAYPALTALSIVLAVSAVRAQEAELAAPEGADAAPDEPPKPADSAQPAIVPPRVVARTAPRYPETRLTSGVEGEVTLTVTVGADGSVQGIEVTQGLSAEFDQEAIAAVGGWTFEPAQLNGAAVAAKIRVSVNFAVPRPAAEAKASPRAPSPAPGASAAPASAEVAEPEAVTEVTVEGQRAKRATQRSASDYSVKRDVLESAPRHEGVEVLRSAPGMYIGRGEGSAVAHHYMLRGFDSEHGQDIEFRVGGIPINLPAHIHGQGYADLGFLIAETVDEVRATEGVHDPRQGDFAVAGTIDIQLGVRERGLRSKSSYGSFDSYRQVVLWAPPSQLADSFGAVSLQGTAGFGQNRRGQSLSAIVQQGFGEEDWRTRATGIFYTARADSAGVLRNDDVEAGRVGFYDVYQEATARAQNALAGRAILGVSSAYSGVTGDSAELGVWLGFDHFRAQQNFTGFLERSQTLADVAGRGDLIEQRNATRSVGVTAGYRTSAYRPSEWIEAYFEVGSSARYDEIDQAQNLLDAQVRLQTWDQRVNAEVRGMDVGFWGDLDVHTTEYLKLRLGVRGDALSYEIADALGNRAPAVRNPESFVVGFRRSAMGIAVGPRTSADVHAAEWLTIHASYGEGFRSPNARTLDDGEQTPFTKVHSSDLGARLHFDESYEVSVAGYHTDLSDDVAFDASEGRLERVGRTRRLGAVLHSQARPLPGLVLAGSITYVDAQLLEPPPATAEDPEPAFKRGQNLPFVPPVVARADVGYERELLQRAGSHPLTGKLGLGFSALSAQPLPYSTFADPVALLDVAGGVGWGPAKLGLEVFNVLDLKYGAVQYSFVSDWDPDAQGSRLPERHTTAGAPRTIMATLELAL